MPRIVTTAVHKVARVAVHAASLVAHTLVRVESALLNVLTPAPAWPSFPSTPGIPFPLPLPISQPFTAGQSLGASGQLLFGGALAVLAAAAALALLRDRRFRLALGARSPLKFASLIERPG
jgi:hypothetical protein